MCTVGIHPDMLTFVVMLVHLIHTIVRTSLHIIYVHLFMLCVLIYLNAEMFGKYVSSFNVSCTEVCIHFMIASHSNLRI